MLPKLNLNVYKFSKESRSELLEFYKAVKISKVPPSNEYWGKILPRDENLVKELDNLELMISVHNSTDLTQIEDTTLKEAEEMRLEDEDNKNVFDLKLNVTSTSDLVESIKENLDTEDSVSEDVIMKLTSECTEDELRTIFNTLFNSLDLEPLCKLGNSIISSCSEHSTVPLSYIQWILIPKVLSEHNNHTETLFLNFLNNHLHQTCQEFTKSLQELKTCPTNVQDNFRSISNQHKQRLLRNFVLNSSKLEPQQFGIVENLLTTELDVETIRKLIDLLGIIANAHVNDKMFGKVVLSLINLCGRNALISEQQLKDIVGGHRSIWKGKLQKALQVCMESNISMSQTLRY